MSKSLSVDKPFLDLIHHGVSVFDTEFRLVSCNARYLALLDYPEEFGKAGTPLEQFVDYALNRNLNRNGFCNEIIQIIYDKTKKFEAYKFRLTSAKGKAVEITGVPLAQNFVISCHDVSAETVPSSQLQRTKTSDSLEVAQLNILLQNVLDSIPVRVFWKDLELKYQGANKLFVADSGCATVEDLIGKTDYELAWPDQAGPFRTDDAEVIHNNQSKLNFEEPQERPDHSIGWLKTNKVPLRSPTGSVIGVLGTYEDITLAKARESALQESEERYKLALQGVHDGIFDWDIDNKTLFMSKTAAAILSLPAKDGAHNENALLDQFPEESQAQFRNALILHFKGYTEYFEYEMSYRTPGGQDVWVLCRGLAVSGEDGRCHRMSGSISDITRRKIAEQEVLDLNANLEKRVKMRTRELEAANLQVSRTLKDLQDTQKELIQSEKMASLGGLVSGVAHEINTPVGVGVTAITYLLDELEELEGKFSDGALKKSDLENYFIQARDNGNIILSNLSRAAGLISSFKRVAVDRFSEELREINLSEYLHEVILSLMPKLKKTKITIRIVVDETLHCVIDPGSLAQIVTNLVMNSLIHAYDDGDEGVITIACSESRDGISLHYSDDGKGMTPEVVHKIYEPFFTTRRGNGGSGLGMHIVYNLVTRNMQGKIDCTSAVDEGTQFKMYFPQIKS